MTSPLPQAKPSALRLDPRAVDRGLSCVHCGLCLPVCPTYTQNGLEGDSPRGRIQLMLGLHEGKIEATETVRHHLDLCLDCRACETACPSNVVYHELIEETRSKLLPAKQSAADRLIRWMFLHVLTKPTRLKLTLLPARLMQRVGAYGLLRKSGLFKLLPAGLRKMEAMLPDHGPLWPGAIRPFTTPVATPQQSQRIAAQAARDREELVRPSPLHPGEQSGSGIRPPRTAVALVAGCIGSVMGYRVNCMALDLLGWSNCVVQVVEGSKCCGAIHHHNGLHSDAEAMARRMIDATFPAGVSDGPKYVTTTIAGCGAMLRDYGTLLRDDPDYAERAKQFASRVRDITEVLAELGLPEMTHPVDMTATYHDACHLIHAQKVAAQPRALLAKVPGLKLVPLPESDMCCGAAGTYNLTQPAMASDLAERKLRHIASTGAQVCIAGNVGCSMHIQSAARQSGQPLKVVHPVEILHRAVFGDAPEQT